MLALPGASPETYAGLLEQALYTNHPTEVNNIADRCQGEFLGFFNQLSLDNEPLRVVGESTSLQR